MINAKEYLIERTFNSVGDTETQRICDDVLELLDEIWDDIKNIPAAKTGKYHPNICNVKPYGLVNHTIRVVHFAEMQCDSENTHDEAREKILFACLFHDIGKSQYYKSIDRVDHGIWAADWLKQRDVNEDICLMVKEHMAHWEDKDLSVNPHARIVAFADYLASQKHIILRHEKFLVQRLGHPELTTELLYILNLYEGKFF